MACASDFDEFINCQICFELFQDPQSLICRHVFCKKCVDRIKDVTKIECPVCKVQSNVSDIKPDYRTVFMVDSYRKNLTKDQSVNKEKDELLSKCEECDDKVVKVTHKCETCDFLLCEKCEASHTGSESDGGGHTTKPISAIASDARTKINRTLTDLKAQKEVLETKLSKRQQELDDVRQTSDNAMKSISEEEENLHSKITYHHDNLRKMVEKEKTKRVKKSKQEYKNMKLCYHDVNDKELLLNSWVSNRCDLEIVNTTEQIQKKLKDIEKESTENPQCGTSAEHFTVKIIEGTEYDTNGSTKLMFSMIQPVGEEGAATGLGSHVEEASVSILSDYTTAEHRDYKAEKTVEVSGKHYSNKQIDYIKQYNGHLYCMKPGAIDVYTEDLICAKTITLGDNSWGTCRGFSYVNEKHFITASSNSDDGLRILVTGGKDIQRICRGEFYGLAIHNHKLYAYEYTINKVLIFEQTRPYMWNNIGDIYLDFNGNNEHKSKNINSFLMENEQIYIADDTSIYQLDTHGKLKRKISQGKDNKELKNPRICSADSKGNLLVVEPEKKTLTVIGKDGRCSDLLLRGQALNDVYFAYMGHENECLWVAHYEWPKLSCLTKYRTTSTKSVIM